MKQRVTFRAAKVDLGSDEEKRASIEECLGKSTDELFADIGSYQELSQRFIKDDTITVEFDTEAQTATVIEVE